MAMTQRIAFLREQTLSSKNKIARRAIPDWSVAEEPCSLPERKALGLKKIFDNMPLFIGEQELIVGTRTLFGAAPGNEDGHSVFDYRLGAYPDYVTEEDIARFGGDYRWTNKTHYTPDFSLILKKGVNGILAEAEERKKDPTLSSLQVEFLNSVIISYTGFKNLIRRYGEYAEKLADSAPEADKGRLEGIAQVCFALCERAPENFREALQLFWFAHIGTIVESFMFICYGRLDVIFGEFLKDTPREEALELLECLLLKMYDQADINDGGYFNKHEGQLVITLGGVLADGENAVNEVTMLFLEAIDHVRLPEPEVNLRVSKKNPPEFLDKAAELTISGCNFLSYYNDDAFVASMIGAGVPAEEARNYGFDLCQDINIPGRGDFYCCGGAGLISILMRLLGEKDDFESYEDLLAAFKEKIRENFAFDMKNLWLKQEFYEMYREGKYEEVLQRAKEENFQMGWLSTHPMSPLPFLSGLYHDTIAKATDMIYRDLPVKHQGAMCTVATEAINSLAAIKKVVYEEKRYSLPEVMQACAEDFQGEGQEVLRQILWNAPKWGNDDAYVDEIAKDIVEFSLREFNSYTTRTGERILAGVHQPHPVSTGWSFGATPEGRHKGAPVAVTLTPESGTMKNGATAALKSATIFDNSLIQWNYCVMVNYFSSVFEGNGGKEIFKRLLSTYFDRGGMQHQPNVMNVEHLRQAQLEPEKYKDLIVRLWGVSAHFVDLPKELQDEMIARLG